MNLPIDTAPSAAMLPVLLKLAEDKTNVQVKLKDISPHPLGPGVLELYGDVKDGIFKIVGEATQHMTGQFGTQQKQVLLPWLFAAADVLWISLPPMALDQAGDKRPSLVIGS